MNKNKKIPSKGKKQINPVQIVKKNEEQNVVNETLISQTDFLANVSVLKNNISINDCMDYENPLVHYLSVRHSCRKNSFNQTRVENVTKEFEVMTAKKKPAIKPSQLRNERSKTKCDNYKLIVESGGVLVPLRNIENKKDLAWNYFKHLSLNSVVSKEAYCELCFESGSLVKYSNSSLTVLKGHLSSKHDINTKNPKMKTIYSIMSGKCAENSKEEIILRLTIYHVMTLTPFHHVESPYTKEMLVFAGLVSDPTECPSERSLSDNGLEKLHRFVHEELKKELSESPSYITAMFDCWTDIARRNYYAIIVRFLSTDFGIKEYVICFKKLQYKDAVTEAETFTKVTNDLGLYNKKFIAVSDKGSDMISVCKLLKMPRQDCIAHGLHNLINADVLPKTVIVKNFLRKLREVLSCLRYRSEDLMVELQLEQDTAKAEWISNFSKIGKLFFRVKIGPLHSNTFLQTLNQSITKVKKSSY